MGYDVKEMVKDNRKVKFLYYKLGELWYETETGFKFPVPTNPEEVGDATFLAEDKALLFMRYIRHHIEYLNEAVKLANYHEPYHATGGSDPIDFPKK